MRERDFAFFTGPRDTGYGISHFHGTRDAGYGISHFSRDHGIRDTGFRIFAQDHGIIPNPINPAGKITRENPAGKIPGKALNFY